MRKFFCARSKKKGEIDVTLLLRKGKKGENSRDSLLFWRGGDLFFVLSLFEKKTRKEEKRGENRGKQIIFKKNPTIFHHRLQRSSSSSFLSLSLSPY
jgi:hypothetical protein|tara:strand:- start:499 stop:789 length:291 start_codon:yes stop_codon:yes gene_type:complete